jgi:hypothetical protein
MKKIIILFLIFIFFGILFKEVYAGQQAKEFPYWGPIMSCNTEKMSETVGNIDKTSGWLGAYSDPCSSFCDLLATGQNALFFAITLALFGAAPLLFLISGVFYVISRGNPQKIQKAKDMFFNVVKGIVIILLSFIIVNTFFVILAPKVPGIDFVKWNQISCNPESVPGSNVPWIKRSQ